MSAVAAIFDLDGVVVAPGTSSVPQDVSGSLATAVTLNFIVSGRGLERCSRIGEQMGTIHGVFAENGPLYRLRGRDVVCAADESALDEFRDAVGMRLVGEREAVIEIDGRSCRIGLEPKRTIISFEPGPSCAWSPAQLAEKLSDLVRACRLRAQIIGPLHDGGIDVQPFSIDGFPLNKGITVDVVQTEFPEIERVFALIDGKNDRPLAEHPRVFPITFRNGDRGIQDIVSRRGGWIIDQVGYLGGCAEAIRRISTFCV